MKLKKDPIEQTDKYKKIKEELEKQLKKDMEKEGIKKEIGYLYVYEQKKKSILKEKYNIEWKTTEEMNPGLIIE